MIQIDYNTAKATAKRTTTTQATTDITTDNCLTHMYIYWIQQQYKIYTESLELTIACSDWGQ